MGDVDDALAAFKTALEQYPAFVQTFVCLGKFFSDSVITYHSEDAVLLIVKLLEKGTIIRPSRVRSSIMQLLILDPSLIKLRKDVWKDASYSNLPKYLRILGKNRLMNVAMRRTPLTSLAIEEFLVYIRKSCLFSSAKIEMSGGDLEFLISLALQADLTEYIYSQSEEEEESVANLASKINSILSSGQQPRDQDILILACYTPLNKLETINLFESTFRTE